MELLSPPLRDVDLTGPDGSLCSFVTADDFYDDPCFDSPDLRFFEDLDPRLVHVGALLKPEESERLSDHPPSMDYSGPPSGARRRNCYDGAYYSVSPLPHPSSEPRPGKGATVSSLDCLSSIVERISTESPAAPALLQAEAPPESPGCQQEATAPGEGELGAPTPSPDTTSQCPAGANPNPIYQVL
ncbi:myoblast determination protein 1 [Fukomys damarensis]|uniref:myoblast determination protein 1 n=1 Tax=Fukomys damarensis TaxID=885580 RepID=UPI0014558F39|nr:myoblast determination protein 1 [Fukomys damarensis]